jgi:ADP-ribose pyrophosphatase YjhB (NUDIX family)
VIDRFIKGIPAKLWLSQKTWRVVTRKLPLTCMDMIFEREDSSILYGYRIRPYSNMWALIGGRLLYGEGLRQCARRISSEYHMSVTGLYLVGVFPVRHRTRFDVSIAIAAPLARGNPRTDGLELAKTNWFKEVPTTLGTNYRKMITKCKLQQTLPEVMAFSRLD